MSEIKHLSFEKLVEQLTFQFTSNNSLKIGDYVVSCNNKTFQEHFIHLLKNGIFIFDYTPTNHTDTQYTRFNFSAFVKRSMIYDLAHKISLLGYFAGVHDPNSDTPHIYYNGIHKTWNKSHDFLTNFKIDFNELGNPVLTKLEHVWDYGNDIEVLRNLIDTEEYQSIKNNYAELTVIANSFDKTHDDVNMLENIVNIITKKN